MPNRKAKYVYTPRKQEIPLQSNNTSLFTQVIIAIAVFIFAVTLSGVLSINSMIQTWNQSILGSLTVQIMPVNDADREKAQAETLAYQERAIDYLKNVKGIAKISVLPDSQLQKLIEPWLGDGVDISSLPIPRIIDIKLEPGAKINFVQLSQDLAKASPQASVDNHKLWLNKLIDFADGLKALAMAILFLVITITSGAIFYTTQTSMGMYKDIIEILHTMGAKDAYVAQQYAKRMAFFGLIGGLIGLFLAIPTIFFIASLAQQIKGGIISEAHLSFGDWILITSLPFEACIISGITAYYTVKKTLQKML